MMRVLTIIDSLAVGGAEQSLAMLTPHLAARGIEMHVAFLKERPGVGERLATDGAVLHSLDGSPGWMASLVRTVRLLRSVRPDLVHTTLYKADIVGRTAAWVLRIPVISSFVTESYGPEHVGNPEYRAWKVRAAQVVDGVTARFVKQFHAVSETSGKVMTKRLRLRDGRVQVITRGRDAEQLGVRTPQRRQAVRDALGVGDDEQLIVSAARHFHLKGLDVLIKAFPKIRASCPNARLLIAGRPGPATAELERLIVDGGVESSVTLAGYRSDIPDLLCAADVFVLPSRTEGSPGALIEAMALEAPTVASDLPSVREIVGNDATVMLAAPDSVPDLTRAVTSLLQDPNLAAAKATAARQRFAERYTISVIADQTVALYQASVG